MEKWKSRSPGSERKENEEWGVGDVGPPHPGTSPHIALWDQEQRGFVSGFRVQPGEAVSPGDAVSCVWAERGVGELPTV